MQKIWHGVYIYAFSRCFFIQSDLQRLAVWKLKITNAIIKQFIVAACIYLQPLQKLHFYLKNKLIDN